MARALKFDSLFHNVPAASAILTVLLLSGFPISVAIAQDQKQPNPDSQQLDKHLRSLDYVYEKVRESTWEEDFDEAGWARKRDEIREKITEDTTIDEVRTLLSEMLNWLGKSHFGILPTNLYEGWGEEDQEESEKKDGHIGIALRLIGDRVLVTEVRSGSDAEHKGVRPGWELLGNKDKDVSQLIQSMKESLSDKDQGDLPTLLAFGLDRRMSGTVGSEQELRFRDGEDNERQLTLTRKKADGTFVEAFNLPPMVVRHSVKKLPEGTSYFHFDAFFATGAILGDLKNAIEIARDGKGLIIDLRGNGGGMAGLAMGVGGPLVSDESEDEQYLGTLKTKDMSLRFVLTPRLNPYDGPVAVLTDECSASTSEFLAGGLQAIERARVFGSRTAGMALPSMIEVLPNGDRFQYAFATYVDSSDRKLEGAGVKPDEPIEVTREALLAGEDPVLEAAVEWIKKQAN